MRAASRSGRSAGWATRSSRWSPASPLGAIESETAVTLAGGTQMVAVAGLLRHAGVEQSLPLATTSYVADDETAAIESAADELDLDLEVTDPGFGRSDHPAMATYAAGEAAEGVGMGGTRPRDARRNPDGRRPRARRHYRRRPRAED